MGPSSVSGCMARRILKVTVDGQTFTRETARTYTHVIVGKLNIGWDLDRVELPSSAKYDRQDHAYFNTEAAASDRARHGDRGEAYRADYEAARRMTADEFVAWRRAARLAGIEKRRAEGRYDKLIAISWCGRPDLAQKELAKQTKPMPGRGGVYVAVRAVPVPSEES